MVTGIQHLQTPTSSPKPSKMNFQKAQTIQLVKKLTCAEEQQEARTCAGQKHQKGAHAPDA
jgi:ribosome assembly protein YihI (activator of Der GTPase)